MKKLHFLEIKQNEQINQTKFRIKIKHQNIFIFFMVHKQLKMTHTQLSQI